MAVYLSWPVEILFTNFIVFIKRGESKQLAVYFFFAHYIALAPILPLLTGFVVLSLLAVLLCHLESRKKGSSWEYGCAWHQLRSLCKYLGGKAEVTTDISWHHLHIVHIAPLYFFEHAPSQTPCTVKLLDAKSFRIFWPEGLP